MFDLSNLRVLTFDQLHAFGIYRLTRALRTTDGREYPPDTEFHFDFAVVNTVAKTAVVNGHIGSEDDTAAFATQGDEHREWFERTGREWRPAPKKQHTAIASSVPLDPAEWAEWLAKQPRFQEAGEILAGRALGAGERNWGTTHVEADRIRDAAIYFESIHPELARWLADQGLHHYYAWMSQATSGGEGTAMQYEVREDLARLRRITGEV